jgi:hypothetical protein
MKRRGRDTGSVRQSRRRAFAALALAGAWGVLAGMAGCNLIVGVGDYAVGDAATDATGDSVVVDGGTTGDAAIDATGDVLVHDSASDSRPSQDAPGSDAPGQTDFQKLVSACVLAVSCDPFFFATTVSECITEDYLQSTTALSCLSNIRDCAGYTACRGTANATLADCPATGAAAKCDTSGNRAINCSGQAVGTVRNCAKLGGTCGTHPDGSGGTMAECLLVASCSDTDTLSHCSGNALYTCVGGKGYGQDCGAIDATCATVGTDTSCFLNAPTCGAAGYACSGTALGWCTSGGQHFNFDCSRAMLSCSIDDAGIGGCVAPGASSCSESCGADGKTITACIGGTPHAIDCSQYGGFTQCTTATDSTGTLYAYCQ